MSKLSVVISAYNEASKIAACLETVRFADEIIVVNNSSTDNTLEIAKQYTPHVFTRKNNLMLNINKNFGFSQASGDWILSLDADERVTPELRTEMQKILKKESETQGYWIPRKNIIFGKWIQNSIWWPDYQLRLFKKNAGTFPEKHVHEMITVIGKTEKLQNPMTHENYATISQYLYKLDKIYTENEVENFINSGKTISYLDAIRFPLNDFLKTFFAQKGYKDGLHGLVLSLLQAFYAEVVFAKIWERQGFHEYNSPQFLLDIGRESTKLLYETRYWYLTQSIEETRNPIKKIMLKIKRKRIIRKISS